MPQPLGDQVGAGLIVVAVEERHVLGVGADVDARGPFVDLRLAFDMGGEVAGGAVGGLDPDLAGTVQSRRVRVSGPLPVPVVEDAGWVLPLLRGLTPVTGRQGAVHAPRSAAQLEGSVAVASDPQEAHGRGFPGAALGERELPPQTLDTGEAALALDGLPDL